MNLGELEQKVQSNLQKDKIMLEEMMQENIKQISQHMNKFLIEELDIIKHGISEKTRSIQKNFMTEISAYLQEEQSKFTVFIDMEMQRARKILPTITEDIQESIEAVKLNMAQLKTVSIDMPLKATLLRKTVIKTVILNLVLTASLILAVFLGTNGLLAYYKKEIADLSSQKVALEIFLQQKEEIYKHLHTMGVKTTFSKGNDIVADNLQIYLPQEMEMVIGKTQQNGFQQQVIILTNQ